MYLRKQQRPFDGTWGFFSKLLGNDCTLKEQWQKFHPCTTLYRISKLFSYTRSWEMLLILSKCNPFSACSQCVQSETYACGFLCMYAYICVLFHGYTTFNFALRIFLSWPPTVWVWTVKDPGVSVWPMGWESFREKTVDLVLQKLVSIGDRISRKGFLLQAPWASEPSGFSARTTPTCPWWVLLWTGCCPLLCLLSAPVSKCVVYSSPASPPLSAHSWKQILLGTSAGPTDPLAPCSFRTGGQHRLELKKS